MELIRGNIIGLRFFILTSFIASMCGFTFICVANGWHLRLFGKKK